MIVKVSSRVEIRIYLVCEVSDMSSLRKNTPHRVTDKSLQI